MIDKRRPHKTHLKFETLEGRDVPSGGQLVIDPSQYASERILVKIDDGTTLRSGLTRSAEDLGGGLYSVSLRPNVTVARGLKHFASLRNVEFAEPDYAVGVKAIPNDQFFNNLYGMHNTGQTGGTVDADIDAPEAWDVSTGSGNFVIAIIDTGVDYNHPDLAANMWTNPAELADGVDNDGNGVIDDIHGADFANNDGDPMDDNGHGTHVAGTIGAVGNNSIGVSGVNWNIKMMAVKFLTAGGSGSITNAIKCLNYAVAEGAKISNNSWGGGGFSSAMSTALDNARAAGHMFVAAAGNSASNNDVTAFYPANYPQDNVLSVASTTSTDALSSFSSYGATTVDLAAPGSSIYSTYRGGYASLSGTSMATPHVAGAAALVWDAHPTWTYLQVIEALKNTVDPKTSLTGRVATGGRLNVNAAIRYGSQPPGDAAGPRIISSSFLGSVPTISGVQVNFDEAVDPTSFTTADASLNGGAIGITSVVQVSSTQYNIFFAPQGTPGTYTMVVGPQITDTAGNAMNQNSNGSNGEVPGDQYTTSYVIGTPKTFNSTDVNKTIRDMRTTISVLNVNENFNITDVNVRMNLSHTYDSDLRISLRAPDGTTVLLVDRRGGSGNNFTNTLLSDEGSVSISQGVAPFSGTFRPERTLSTLDNRNAAGTWQLIIEDLARLDTGRINSWSITFNSNL